MSATSRARAGRWIQGEGIEIGALNAPMTVPGDVAVRYVDRAPLDALRRQYPELADQALVSPSIIGQADDLSALGADSVDFVIANHLVEHLEDPIGALREMVRVIRPGGILFMALPDPRVTFDVDRELTSAEHVIDEFRNGTKQTREDHFRDWVAKAEPHVDWVKAAGIVGGPDRVRQLIEMDYSIHFHVWRPDTFMEFMVVASREAHLELEPVDFQPRVADDNEYIFIFAKGMGGLARDRAPTPAEIRVGSLEAHVAAITGSRSWRLTAPLRVAGRALRRKGQASRPPA